jgi:hypothetical protein
MSIFDKIKGALGFSSTNKTNGKGHILGSAASPATPTVFKSTISSNSSNAVQFPYYDVSFYDDKIGIELESHHVSHQDNSPLIQHLSLAIYITYVIPGQEANRRGVKVGDQIVSVDGNEVSHPEDFVTILSAIARPVTIR